MEEETRLVSQHQAKVTVFEIINREKDTIMYKKSSFMSFNLKILLMLILANILYVFSLDNCTDPVESVCWNYIFPRITRLILSMHSREYFLTDLDLLLKLKLG